MTRVDASPRSGARQVTESERVLAVRRLAAEALGTFALTGTAAAGDVVAAALHVPVSEPVKAVAPALAVAAVIFTMGDVSGAHINPAVTLAFAVRRAFPWRRVPGYLLAQLAGAVAAALTLRALFGRVGGLGATRPHTSYGTVFVVEVLLTTFLVLVILQAATRESLVGPEGAFPVGFTIALAGLIGISVSGASMNPARSLGPVLAGGGSAGWWLYVLGPLTGALLAVGLAWILRGPYTEKEEETASGEG